MAVRLLSAAVRCQMSVYRSISTISSIQISGPQYGMTSRALSSSYGLVSKLCVFDKPKVNQYVYREYCTKEQDYRKGFGPVPSFDREEDINGPFRKIYHHSDVATVKRMHWLKLFAASLSGVSSLYPVSLTPNLESITQAQKFSSATLMIIMYMFLGMSFIDKTKACRVFVNDETEEVKISYINFFAKRTDVVLNLSDLDAKLTDTPNKVLLRTNGTTSQFGLYYLNLCTPEEMEELERYFGDF